MKRCVLLYLIALCLAVSASAWSLPINDYNELVNGDFETGDLTGWQAGADIIVAPDGPGYGYSATCVTSGGDLWLRQIVDDSLSPDWNWDLNAKVIDLVAEITWDGWEPPDSIISFRLDWWDMRYNDLDDPTALPYYLGPPPPGSDPAAGYFASDWVTYTFTGYTAREFRLVNPFDQIYLPIQPRWVSVEVLYDQQPGESVWLDKVMLTGACVPEPASGLVLLTGAAPIVWALRARKRR